MKRWVVFLIVELPRELLIDREAWQADDVYQNESTSAEQQMPREEERGAHHFVLDYLAAIREISEYFARFLMTSRLVDTGRVIQLWHVDDAHVYVALFEKDMIEGGGGKSMANQW